MARRCWATSTSRPMRCRMPNDRTSPRWHQRPRLRGRCLCAGRAQLDQRQVDGGQSVRCAAVDRRVPAGVQYRLLSDGVMRIVVRGGAQRCARLGKRPRVVQKEEWMSRRKLFESPEPSSQMLGVGPAYVSVEGLRQLLAVPAVRGPAGGDHARAQRWLLPAGALLAPADDDPLAAAPPTKLDAAGFQAEDIQQVEQGSTRCASARCCIRGAEPSVTPPPRSLVMRAPSHHQGHRGLFHHLQQSLPLRIAQLGTGMQHAVHVEASVLITF